MTDNSATIALRWAKEASPNGYIAQALAVAKEPERYTAEDRAKASRILRAQRLVLDAIRLDEYRPGAQP